MLHSLQQQFESMNVVFNNIQDRMDRQGAVIASLRENRPRRAFNARRQRRRARLDDSDDYHEDRFEDEDDQASLNNVKENLVLYPIQNSQRKRHSWIYFIHD